MREGREGVAKDAKGNRRNEGFQSFHGFFRDLRVIFASFAYGCRDVRMLYLKYFTPGRSSS